MLLKKIPIFVDGTLRSDGPNTHSIKPHATVSRRAEAWGSLHYADYVDEKVEIARTTDRGSEITRCKALTPRWRAAHDDRP